MSPREKKSTKTSFELSPKQKDILNASGNLLVLGGPGSGKTTVAILKADKLVRDRCVSTQKILFLSFARPTVSRVMEAVRQHSSLTEETRRYIDVDTYHAFFWRIIKTHGYLLGLPRRISILPPMEEAVSLSEIRSDYVAENKLSEAEKAEKKLREKKEQERLAYEEGKVCFDLFADLAADLLKGSQKIRQLVSLAFTTVILDEFQDTNAGQWDVVKELGKNSTLIALADPEQSIYGFIGADPERINQYREYAKPKEFNLASANYRSTKTDIVKFGNDILEGKFRRFQEYKGIQIIDYPPNKNQAPHALKIQIYSARERLIKQKENGWSLAVLVPTKKMMRQVSEVLSQTEPEIRHYAAIDVEGAMLAAEILAFLLQPKLPGEDICELLGLLGNFFRGKGGDTPTATAIEEVRRIERATEKVVECENTGKKLPKNSIVHLILAVYQKCRNLKFLGNPEKDWSTVRDILQDSECKRLSKVAEEARNIRLLGRGTQLREALSQAWRETGAYADALDIVKNSLAQEHFARSKKPETGISVMNMHKAKGHQFDEVIIFEGWPRRNRGIITSNSDRIVRGNKEENNSLYARQNLHVSITRAKSCTTIMTPKNDRCILLPLAPHAESPP